MPLQQKINTSVYFASKTEEKIKKNKQYTQTEKNTTKQIISVWLEATKPTNPKLTNQDVMSSNCPCTQMEVYYSSQLPVVHKYFVILWMAWTKTIQCILQRKWDTKKHVHLYIAGISKWQRYSKFPDKWQVQGNVSRQSITSSA